MPLPDIQFNQIREHEGSRDRAFEELCCQLARLDGGPAGSVFYRKGPGRDAGLECYRRLPDGREEGWQAKYYWRMDASLTGSLDKSLDSALDRHPALIRFVVCIPFDLPNPGGSKDPGAIGKWETWKTTREEQAQIIGRSLTIDLWTADRLKDRLMREGSDSGRILFWFSKQVLSTGWCKEHLDKTIANLGRRYTAESHVDLPIRRALLGISRSPAMWLESRKWIDSFQLNAQMAVLASKKLHTASSVELPCDLGKAVDDLCAVLDEPPPEVHQLSPVKKWEHHLAIVQEAIERTFHWPMDYGGAAGPSKETQDEARYALSNLWNGLGKIAEALKDPLWRYVDDQAVIVIGDGGVGKSHLLADVARYQIDKGRPVVLLLGQHFIDGDPWSQIINGLDLPPGTRTAEFLGALNAAAEAAGGRGLLMIDALNEKHGLDLWPSRLAGFLKDVRRYPCLAVILSCRTTFLSHIVSDSSLDESNLPRLTHPGFRPDDARAYLKVRGFVLPGMPVPAPEFSIPLFLRTWCDVLERDGLHEFPKSMGGSTQIFDFYLKAISDQVHKRLLISADRGVVQDVVKALANRMAEVLSDDLPKKDVYAIIDDIQRANRGIRGELLDELIGEGLLWDEVSGKDSRVVRFTFQRVSDHAIATALLNDHVKDGDFIAAFSKGGPLWAYLDGEASRRMAGVVEAFAVQIPERYGAEIVGLVPKSERERFSYLFRNSFLWRRQDKFSSETFNYIKEIFDETEIVDILLSIATEPDNPFNADFLDSKLQTFPMAQRDAQWSIPLACLARDDKAASWILIDWAWASGFGEVDKRRAELAGVTLTWFLTTSHRRLRDRATKALATLLARRGWLMCGLLTRFWGVDDDYLRERLLAAIYGGALQGLLPAEDLQKITKAVYERLFADGLPPPNLLLRDHGRWLVEYALTRCACPAEIDLMKVRPPYKSLWPLEIVAQKSIKKYNISAENGNKFPDEIVNSTVKDRNFARYIIDDYVKHWSPAPIGVKNLPSQEDISKEWQNDFNAIADKDAREAYVQIQNAKRALGSSPHWIKTPAREAYDLALKRFQEILTPEQWADFRSRTGDWWNDGMFNGSIRASIAMFDLSWARRWVCKRAHDFGWSENLHNKFDSGSLPSSDVSSNPIERIGKKYQWMALYELGGRLSDNCAWIKSGKPAVYTGERFGRLRNLDPSLLISQTHDDGWTDFTEPTWWSPLVPQFFPATTEKSLIWLYSDDDFIDGERCLDVMDPGGRRWLVLSSSLSVRERSFTQNRFTRDTWSRITCFVVARNELSSELDRLADKPLIKPDAIPSFKVSGHRTSLGEYPWHLNFDTLPSRHEVMVGEYYCEEGSSDYSLDGTVRLAIPAPWLCLKMGLRLSNGKDVTYIDQDGIVRFFDPSLAGKGPHAGLVDRDAFLTLLDKEGLAAVWVIAGEKNVLRSSSPMAFGGTNVFTTLYVWESGSWTQRPYRMFEAPTREQVAPMFDGRVPDWVRMR